MRLPQLTQAADSDQSSVVVLVLAGAFVVVHVAHQPICAVGVPFAKLELHNRIFVDLQAPFLLVDEDATEEMKAGYGDTMVELQFSVGKSGALSNPSGGPLPLVAVCARLCP